MKSINVSRCWVFVLPVACLFATQFVVAAEPHRAGVRRSAKLPLDIALQDGGILYGRIYDANGLAKAQSEVVLVMNSKPVAIATTDQQGQFVIRGVRGGVYRLETNLGGGLYRVWAPGTAPPSAKQSITVVAAGRVVRGQSVLEDYGDAMGGAVAGGLISGATFWALDFNREGS